MKLQEGKIFGRTLVQNFIIHLGSVEYMQTVFKIPQKSQKKRLIVFFLCVNRHVYRIRIHKRKT